MPLDPLLEIPWERNPLRVFNLTKEEVLTLKDRPAALRRYVSIMKRAKMLAVHGDHSGDDTAASELNRAQQFIEDDYYLPKIIDDFLRQDDEPTPLESKLRDQLKAVRQQLDLLTKQLTELQERGPRTVPVTNADELSRGYWLASHLPHREDLRPFVDATALLPQYLPALAVVDQRSGRSLYTVSRQRQLSYTRQPKRWLASPKETVEALLVRTARELAPKDDDSQIRLIRAGYRAAEETIAQTVDRCLETNNPAELNALCKYRWWPNISERPTPFASEHDWRRWGEMYGQQILAEDVRENEDMWGSAGRVTRGSLAHLEALKLKLCRQMRAEQERTRGQGAGLPLIFSETWRERTKSLLWEKLRGAAFDVVLGSIPSAAVPDKELLGVMLEKGVEEAAVAAFMPRLVPTLTVDSHLVTSTWPEHPHGKPGAVPHVHVEVHGRILYTVHYHEAFLRAEMQLTGA